MYCTLIYSNSMEYKDDMDGPKFEQFIHELAVILKERHGDKIAVVKDNASYHTILVS